ncbi:MAG: hypothetical protein MUF72_09365 [Elainella sp. Prado103]|nr:hypothetical protein [Elainella sp. Prado103]
MTIYTDPQGDTFGFGTIQPDLESVSGAVENSNLVLTLDFYNPIAAPSTGFAESVFGYIDLDLDQNAATGTLSNQLFFAPPEQQGGALGVEVYISLFSEQFNPGLVNLIDTSTFGTIGQAAISYGGDQLEIEIPLILLQDYLGVTGAIHFGSIVGTGSGATDAAPDTEVAVVTDIPVIPPNRFTGTANADFLIGTNGRDLISGLAGNDTIQALNGIDEITGGDGNDLIYAGGGNDKASGGLGDDQIFGEAGNDSLNGSDGLDVIAGGDGNDTIAGGVGTDRITGDLGNDTISGGADDDNLDGGEGDDTIFGGHGNDRIFGGLFFGFDTLNGEGGNDTIDGGAGGDTITGGAGADLLFGGEGYDALNGGEGNDTLNGVNLIDPTFGFAGQYEQDTLTGGGGRDLFVLGDSTQIYYDDQQAAFSGEFDYARITDFQPGQDKIQLKGNASLYELDFYVESGISKAALIYDPGNEVRGELVGILEGVSTSLRLTSSSFVYV